jgi:hypothetical protein
VTLLLPLGQVPRGTRGTWAGHGLRMLASASACSERPPRERSASPVWPVLRGPAHPSSSWAVGIFWTLPFQFCTDAMSRTFFQPSSLASCSC